MATISYSKIVTNEQSAPKRDDNTTFDHYTYLVSGSANEGSTTICISSMIGARIGKQILNEDLLSDYTYIVAVDPLSNTVQINNPILKTGSNKTFAIQLAPIEDDTVDFSAENYECYEEQIESDDEYY